jgi:hypothetical protein
MTKGQFEAFLPIKIQSIIKIMMLEENISFYSALEELYSSETYNQLMDFDLRFWHFSDYKLLEFLKLENNNIELTLNDI